MTSSLDIYRTAALLIREYGAQALAIAVKRAHALDNQKDVEGTAVWLGIANAIRALNEPSDPNRPKH